MAHIGIVLRKSTLLLNAQVSRLAFGELLSFWSNYLGGQGDLVIMEKKMETIVFGD